MQKLYLRYVLLLLVNIVLSGVSGLMAQTTTSSVVGKILDDKGEAMVGVVVVAKHVPTGTVYSTTTGADGRYYLPNLNPGGPYQVSARMIGYATQNSEDLSLGLGVTTTVNYKMTEENKQLQEVTIKAAKDVKTGPSVNIKKEQLNTMPTISRSITDMTRLTPQASNNSFAGTNFRYNNITLDGAINNDAISFSPSLGGVSGTSGMPASSTRNNPFSLDAIQEVQVAVSPFEVTLGNFTGGSINAITRSGTNEVTGSVYGFGRNASITGKSVDGRKTSMPGNYNDYQTGFRLGLPLIKDKLFLFTNAEVTHREEPLFYGAGTQGSVLDVATAQRISDSLQSSTFMPGSFTLGTGSNQGTFASKTFNPGAYQDYSIKTNSTKIFARIDWNINSKHQLVLRHNYVSSDATNLERSVGVFKFGSQDFTQNNVLNSTVLELKSRFTNHLSNSLILGYTNIHDYRSPMGSTFPQIQINNVNIAGQTPGQVFLGTDREAAIFNMRQQNFEFTDNVKYFVKRHAITIGTHNEFYKIDYGFINSWNGRFDYNNLTDFYNNSPARMRSFFNLGDNSYNNNYNNPSASFNIYLLSGYIQDEWAISDKLKVTPGLRFDMAVVPQGPTLSGAPYVGGNNTDANYGNTYEHTSMNTLNNKLFGQVMVSPRIGFNYDVKGDGKIIVRGGSGLFTGRIPFAWLGYAYYNNGVNFGAYDYKPATVKPVNIPTDPSQYQQFGPAVGGAPRREVDLVDKNFHMPQVWRTSLATDIKLPGDYKLTLEGIYTKTIYDIKFQMINIVDSVKYVSTDPGHQQPIYLSSVNYGGQRINGNFSNAYLLSNTSEGYRYNFTVQLSKLYKLTDRSGINAMAAYTYGASYDISNGIRNSPESNWQLNPALSANNPALSYSNFDMRNRIIANIGFAQSYGKEQKYKTYLSMFFSAQSGSPYTYATFNNGKVTNSGQQLDLAYIPASQNEVIWTDAKGVALSAADQAAMYNSFSGYVKGDNYLKNRVGQFTERNAARTPWNIQADLRLMQDIRFKTSATKYHVLQITFDIVNFTNLLNAAWGRVYFVPNTNNNSVNFGLTPQGTKVDTDGQLKYMYNFVAPTTNLYSIDQLASRWQGQLGVRYSF